MYAWFISRLLLFTNHIGTFRFVLSAAAAPFAARAV